MDDAGFGLAAFGAGGGVEQPVLKLDLGGLWFGLGSMPISSQSSWMGRQSPRSQRLYSSGR